MKITKFEGLGRYGAYIDDVDLKNITQEQWLEIGRLHLEQKVTILRNVNISAKDFEPLMMRWGKFGGRLIVDMYKDLIVDARSFTPEQQILLDYARRIMASELRTGSKVMKVSAQIDELGRNTGLNGQVIFSWHIDEGGQLAYAPNVTMLGARDMVGSATEFCSTIEWYESQSNSFRSELDEMVVEHEWQPERVLGDYSSNHTSTHAQEIHELIQKAFCPETRLIPLVHRDSAGDRCLYWSRNSMRRIQGMSDAASKRFFNKVDQEVYTDKWCYKHEYKNDNDLVIMDNTGIIHRRQGGADTRLLYKLHTDYTKIYERYNMKPQRYLSEPYITELEQILSEQSSIQKQIEELRAQKS